MSQDPKIEKKILKDASKNLYRLRNKKKKFVIFKRTILFLFIISYVYFNYVK